MEIRAAHNSTYKLCRSFFYFGVWADFLKFNFTDSGTTYSCKTLGASVADDKTTFDKLTKHRKKEWH
jgi:hypothetical protein